MSRGQKENCRRGDKNIKTLDWNAGKEKIWVLFVRLIKRTRIILSVTHKSPDTSLMLMFLQETEPVPSPRTLQWPAELKYKRSTLKRIKGRSNGEINKDVWRVSVRCWLEAAARCELNQNLQLHLGFSTWRNIRTRRWTRRGRSCCVHVTSGFYLQEVSYKDSDFVCTNQQISDLMINIQSVCYSRNH